MTLLAGGTENAADAVDEPAASKSAAIPSAIAVFCTTRLSLSAVGDVSTVAHHRAYLSRISIIIVPLATFLSRRNWRPLQAVKCQSALAMEWRLWRGLRSFPRIQL
jgi:hypothetical protein